MTIFKIRIYFLTNFFSNIKHQIEDIKVYKEYKSTIEYIDYKSILIKFNYRLQEMCHFESVTRIFVDFIKRQFLLKWKCWEINIYICKKLLLLLIVIDLRLIRKKFKIIK